MGQRMADAQQRWRLNQGVDYGGSSPEAEARADRRVT